MDECRRSPRRSASRTRASPYAALPKAMLRAGTRSSTGCPRATFFHRSGWRAILEDVFRHRTHYLLAERSGEVTGVLPLAEVRSRLFGHALVSLPFCVYGGPASDEPQASSALIDEAARARPIAATFRTSSCATAKSCAPDWPRQDLYVTFRKDLAAGRRSQPRSHSAQAAGDGAQGHEARPAQRDRTTIPIASSPCMPTTCIATARRPCRSATFDACARRSGPTARC